MSLADAFGTEEGPSTRLEVVDQPDPIRAWKSIAIGGDEHTVYLVSHHTRLAVSLEQQATCSSQYTYLYGGKRPSHGAVPELTCGCGWYAVKDRSKLTEMGYGGLVVAEVDLYGTVIEAEQGYRAEYQRVLAILIRRDYCMGGFLCGAAPELLEFEWKEEERYLSGGQVSRTKIRRPKPVCRTHAGEDSVELSQVASRLGVEVRWFRGQGSDS